MVFSNIETAAHTWLADEWPEHLQFRTALGIPMDGEDILNHMVVPRTDQGLLSWAYVGTNHSATDRSRTLRLMYKNPPLYKNNPPHVIYPVGVRVQGFVDTCNLRPLGNWKRGSPPSSALQCIVLSGGAGLDHQFSQYKAAISEIITYIYRCLNVHRPTSEVQERSTIFAARRVFTKINARNCHLPSALGAGDDPTNDSASVETNWKVLDKVNVGMFVPDDVDPTDGAFVSMDPFHLRSGDFVDVCLGFDIVSRGSRGGRTVQVHLTIDHILLLSAAEKATVVGPGPEVVEDVLGLRF
ncbi:hypothetical protein DFH08DRAFT_969900 [Mycena albidolilacea]|uniref:Uncharacterized protein n=1 Tax=Mycena albidolilacea TaxID=1033008 RepID=A0AAD7EG64_9AGAR|nr:hypothetical protein DFH08DRAFT_977099 [Mycena albidolilacea]KAJ7322013.1 hypothetical protein DFH08DRAFT_969900 [Mycena albidolilacea]